jgi:hypothetical protein
MIAPAFIPMAGVADGACVRFMDVIARLRKEDQQGDARAAFALRALTVVQPTIAVSYRFILIDPRAGKYVRGPFVSGGHGLQ